MFNKTTRHNSALKSLLKEDGKTKIDEYFNKQNIDTEADNKNGYTYLHHAVRAGKPDISIIKLLLQQENVDIDAQDDRGQTALIIACNNQDNSDRSPNSEIISELLSYKCDIHIKDHASKSALCHAISTWRGNATIINLLINHGADINDFSGTSPLQQAVQQQDDETISMLLCYNADVTPFFTQPCRDYNTLAARELMYPFVSVCDMDVLRCVDLSTLYDMWWCVDKKEFGEWCVEQQDVVLVEAIFSTGAYKEHLGIEVFSRMLHVFFNEAVLGQLMFRPIISERILELLPQFGRYHLDDCDMADILRILLSNCAYIRRSVVDYLQDAFRSPANIIRVLEDFNVTVKNDDTKSKKIENNKQNSSLLWRMYSLKNFNVGTISMFEVVDELLTLSEFYNFNLNVDNNVIFPHCDCTLVELCRNRIRALCKGNLVDVKPFEYARRIKVLPIPKVLQNVVLLRVPLYQRTSLYMRRPPNYTARW